MIQSTQCSPRTISVLIASYRRPDDLARCLRALAAQTVPADEVIVVAREDDEPTKAAARAGVYGSLPVRVVSVRTPGTVAARNAGLSTCSTDVIAMTDDDTVADPTWLERILMHFRRDRQLGGLGGRDRIHDGTRFNDDKAELVGKVQWFGRVVGNHHIGFGRPREVDVLKGANMSFRAQAVAQTFFDERLRGRGAQPSEEIGFSLRVKMAGWKIIYDPAVLVEHYHAPRERHEGTPGAVRDVQGYRDMAFNEVVALWPSFPIWRRAVYALWSILVGTSVCPGLLQALRFTRAMGSLSWRRFIITQEGKAAAYLLLLRPGAAYAEGRGDGTRSSARPSSISASSLFEAHSAGEHSP